MTTSAHRINQGLMPDLSPPGAESDFYFVQADDPETAVAASSNWRRHAFPSGSASIPSA